MEDVVRHFLKVTDESTEKLSHMREGQLSTIASWILSNRRVEIAFVTNNNAYLIKISPDKALDTDTYSSKVLNSQQEIDKFSPLPPGVSMHLPGFIAISNFRLYKGTPTAKLYDVPVGQFDGLLMFGTEEQMRNELSEESAKRGALDLWNKRATSLKPDVGSYFEQLSMVFDKFQCLIKRKSFLEKRIHRYLYEHADKLLPSHKKPFFEHELILDGKSLFADFILQMEEIQPALLIELENPTVILIKKNGELTAEGMHARNQIMEWVKFIDRNPENTKGNLSFLQGNKRRLVVMGNSNGNIEALRDNSIYSDTIFWTYDVLLDEAKKRWNKIIEEQCNVLGIKMDRKF